MRPPQNKTCAADQPLLDDRPKEFKSSRSHLRCFKVLICSQVPAGLYSGVIGVVESFMPGTLGTLASLPGTETLLESGPARHVLGAVPSSYCL